VYVLSYPTFDTRRRLAGTGAGVVFASAAVPQTSPQAYARAAANDAGTGKLFFVYPGHASIAQLGAAPGPVADFLGALPRRFHEVGSRIFPGFINLEVSVAVFDGSGAAVPAH
jgi:hypothetical protein